MRCRSVLVVVALLNSCGFRAVRGFRVVPGNPEDLLRSPDTLETPFPQILRQYNGFEPGQNAMDLRPRMELRVENAYYQEGMPKRGLNGFLGTEIARYHLPPGGGLKLISVQSMNDRPPDQPPVEQLIPGPQQHLMYYRFYFEIVFKPKARSRGSVLLGANSVAELDRVAALLTSQPDTACERESMPCVIFPEACTVSVEMEIVVNGARRSVTWGTTLGSLGAHPRQVILRRLYAGKLTPVQLGNLDSKTLKLPLLPGDRVEWK